MNMTAANNGSDPVCNDRTVRSSIFAALASTLLMLGGCAGPVATYSGISGAALPPESSIKIAALKDGESDFARTVRQAVEAELMNRGHQITDDASTIIEFAISERMAQTGIGQPAGHDLSPAKKQAFLQSCADRTHRLTLVIYHEDKPGVTRAWAEEHHCHGQLSDSLSALANRAIASLENPDQAGSSLRRGKD